MNFRVGSANGFREIDEIIAIGTVEQSEGTGSPRYYYSFTCKNGVTYQSSTLYETQADAVNAIETFITTPLPFP